jgi:predicted deacylase
MKNFSHEIETYYLGERCDGDSWPVRVHTLKSREPGPCVYIQASMHGSEVQGNGIIYHLLDYLNKNPFKGTFIIAPLVNPRATSQKRINATSGRFCTLSGENHNRLYFDLFGKHEHLHAQKLGDFCKSQVGKSDHEIITEFKNLMEQAIDEIKENVSLGAIPAQYEPILLAQKLAAKADIVLDFHTAPIGTEYLYSMNTNLESAKAFGIENILSIEPEYAGALDEASYVPWHQLKKLLESSKQTFTPSFESFTLEWESEEVLNLTRAHEQLKKVLSYLGHKGVLSSKEHSADTEVYDLENFKTLYAPAAGLCDYQVNVGDTFTKGDVIATILNFGKLEDLDQIEKQALNQVVAPFTGKIINRNPSSIIQMGQELYQFVKTD